MIVDIRQNLDRLLPAVEEMIGTGVLAISEGSGNDTSSKVTNFRPLNPECRILNSLSVLSYHGINVG